MLKIRMQRQGRRNRAHFRIVLTDARVKRQGEYLEKLGHYDPMGKDDEKITVDLDRVKHWVGQGAQATEKVSTLLRARGLNLKALVAEKAANRKKKAASKQS